MINIEINTGDYEEWMAIVGYEGRYEVSNLGNVKSLEKFQNMPRHGHLKVIPEHYLTFNIGGNSPYAKVSMSSHTKVKRKEMIHRLVAKAFIPNPNNKPEVNHINGIKTDNHAENLEWVTAKENQQHSVRMGLHVRKLSEIEVLEIRDKFESGHKKCNTMRLAEKYNVSSSTINGIIKRKQWTHI